MIPTPLGPGVNVRFRFCSVKGFISVSFFGTIFGGHEDSEIDFEKINEEAFWDRVIGHNYTKEKNGGENVKYYN